MTDPRALLASLHTARAWRAVAALLAEHGHAMSGAAWRLASLDKSPLTRPAVLAICAACGVEPPAPDAATAVAAAGIKRAVVVGDQVDTALLVKLDGQRVGKVHLFTMSPKASKTQPQTPVEYHVSATYRGVGARGARKPLSIPRLPQSPPPRPKTRRRHTVNFEAVGRVLGEAAGYMSGAIVTNDTRPAGYGLL